MYTVTDNRKRNFMISFEDVEIGDFFYGQIFDGSYDENKEQFCLKVDEENYFCFSEKYNCLLCYVDCSVAVIEIFDNDNKSKVKIIIE